MCGGDPEQRRIVEELLAENAGVGSFLEHPPFALLKSSTTYVQLSAQTGRLMSGQILIDRFVIVRFIARGGMGEVYEVEDRFLQGVHVALKTILPHIADSQALRQRFEREV